MKVDNNDFKKKIPNILTLFRIILIPILILSFYFFGRITNLIVAFLFMLASITDYFDGYLARYYKVQSNFGKCFDPIADKLLVSVALIMLVNFSNQNILVLIPSIIIICREILVSGMREFLASIKVSVPVTRLSKWKTAIQMMAITALLLASKGSTYTFNNIMNAFSVSGNIRQLLDGSIELIGIILLNISAILTIITGYAHCKVGLKNM